MGKLAVSILNHEYDVHIGPDTYRLFATDYSKLLDSADRIAIIADEHVAAIHLPILQQALEAEGREIVVKTVPSGEHCKTPAVYTDCLSFLLNRNFTRDSL